MVAVVILTNFASLGMYGEKSTAYVAPPTVLRWKAATKVRGIIIQEGSFVWFFQLPDWQERQYKTSIKTTPLIPGVAAPTVARPHPQHLKEFPPDP
jgi:hypothetical protein